MNSKVKKANKNNRKFALPFDMWSETHSGTYKKFIIPVGDSKPKKRWWWQFWRKKDTSADKQIQQLIEDYKEDISWGEYNGEVVINGEKYIPYNKQMWFPSQGKETPNIENIDKNIDKDVDTE